MSNLQNESGKGQQGIKVVVGIIIAAAALTVALVIFLSGSKPTVYTIAGGELQITGSYGQTIQLADIQKVELKTDLPGNLRRTNGYGLGSVIKGYCSSDMGDVSVYIDTSRPPFIYLTTKSGTVILCDETAEKTKELYSSLTAAVKQ